MKYLFLFCIACLCSVVFGCATRYGADAVLLDVPFCVQENNHCGSAAMEMVMRYYALSPDRSKIEQAVYVPVLKGSTPGLLVEVAKNAGLDACVLRGSFAELKSWLTMRIPPIIFLRYEKDNSKGHFVVVTGISGSGARIRIHSGKRANRWMNTDAFLELWEIGRFVAIPIAKKVPVACVPEESF